MSIHLRGPNKPADQALLIVTRTARRTAVRALGGGRQTEQPVVPACWVYFIRTGDAVKIGYARDPYTRLMNLRTASPDDVTCLGIMPGGITEERAVHERFAHLHVRGEWFRAEQELLDFVAEHRFDADA